MTLDKLIERLSELRDRIGGEWEVKVVDGDGEWGFAIRYETVDDGTSETGTGNAVYLDTTAEPE